MVGLSMDAMSDKIRIGSLCMLMIRKGLLTYEEFEELVIRTQFAELIETMPGDKLHAVAPKLFEIADPENKTKWRERHGHPKEKEAK